MTNRTKVIHITYSLEQGGAEVMILDLLRGLDRNIFDLSVCSFQLKGSLRSSFEKSHIPVYDVLKASGKDVTLPVRLYRLFKRLKPDLVHAHNGYMWIYAGLPARLAGAKVVYTEHSVWENPSIPYLMSSKVLEVITDRIVAPSEHVKKLLSLRQHVNSDNIDVIYNGIDLARIEKKVDVQLKRETLGLSPEGKVIGIVARLVPVKNHKTLIEAMKIVCSKMNECRLLIVGDGELRSSLEKLVLQNGLKERVLFLGNRSDVDEILQILDLFVLCSVSEGFPISILEAMAAGVPILATAVGGIIEAIKRGESGMLIDVPNPQTLAEGIMELLTNASKATHFKESALRRVRSNFSLEAMARQYSKLYRELTNKSIKLVR